MPNLAFPPAGLFAEGERLPAIKSWLLDTVWTGDRYRQTEPEHYLRTGEEAVCLLAASRSWKSWSRGLNSNLVEARINPL